MQNFLGCGLPQAVHVVNDLRTCRLLQFEHVVASELPALFDQFDLSVGAHETLLTYVKSLEDWVSGVIKWHLDTGRYKHLDSHPLVAAGRPWSGPTGLGTSAARIVARRGRGKPGSRPGRMTPRAPGLHR